MAYSMVFYVTNSLSNAVSNISWNFRQASNEAVEMAMKYSGLTEQRGGLFEKASEDSTWVSFVWSCARFLTNFYAIM